MSLNDTEVVDSCSVRLEKRQSNKIKDTNPYLSTYLNLKQ